MAKHQKIKHHEIPSIVAMSLKNLFEAGNFYYLRKKAHQIIGSREVPEKDLALAQHMLYVTMPDAMAMLAGVLCLAFSIIIAFLVAY